MKRSQRLQSISRIARNEERDAARDLGRARSEVTKQEEQLAALQRYRQDYAQQFVARGQQGMSAQQLQEYQQFLLKLDQAISQQQQQLERARHVVQRHLQLWTEKHTRVKAMDKAIQHTRDQEELDQGRREQKELDEFANRRLPHSK